VTSAVASEAPAGLAGEETLRMDGITVRFGDEIVKRMRTSTGVPGASTPTGHFAVTDRLSTGVEEGPYGCCVLALSAVQPLHLSDWDGGNRIAIHATDDTADLGHPASHGCARISNADADWLYPQTALGTPVMVYDTTGKSPGVDNAPAGAAPGY